MTDAQIYANVIAFTAEKYKDTFDKGGQPYFLHCYTVSEKQKTMKGKICGMAHDLMEDFEDVSPLTLLALGMTSEMVKICQILTHNKEDDYLTTYIYGVATHPVATDIKLADLEHNSLISRRKSLGKKDFDKLQIYITAYTYLKGA